jgi:hypothetical protein
MTTKIKLFVQLIIYPSVLFLFFLAFETDASRKEREELVKGKSLFFRLFCGRWEFLTMIDIVMQSFFYLISIVYVFMQIFDYKPKIMRNLVNFYYTSIAFPLSLVIFYY